MVGYFEAENVKKNKLKQSSSFNYGRKTAAGLDLKKRFVIPTINEEQIEEDDGNRDSNAKSKSKFIINFTYLYLIILFKQNLLHILRKRNTIMIIVIRQIVHLMQSISNLIIIFIISLL